MYMNIVVAVIHCNYFVGFLSNIVNQPWTQPCLVYVCSPLVEHTQPSSGIKLIHVEPCLLEPYAKMCTCTCCTVHVQYLGIMEGQNLILLLCYIYSPLITLNLVRFIWSTHTTRAARTPRTPIKLLRSSKLRISQFARCFWLFCVIGKE